MEPLPGQPVSLLGPEPVGALTSQRQLVRDGGAIVITDRFITRSYTFR